MSGESRGGGDRIESGTGQDLMYGDAVTLGAAARGGDDLFVFAPASARDTIFDFRQDEDRIDVSAYGFQSIAELDLEVVGADTIVHFDAVDANFVTVLGVTTLGASDFVFT